MSPSAGNRPVPSLFHLTTSVVHRHINTHTQAHTNKQTHTHTHTPPGLPALGNRCGSASAVPSSRGRMYGLACPPHKLVSSPLFPRSPILSSSPPPCLFSAASSSTPSSSLALARTLSTKASPSYPSILLSGSHQLLATLIILPSLSSCFFLSPPQVSNFLLLCPFRSTPIAHSLCLSSLLSSSLSFLIFHSSSFSLKYELGPCRSSQFSFVSTYVSHFLSAFPLVKLLLITHIIIIY